MLAWQPGRSSIRAYALACSVLKSVTSAGVRCCRAPRRAVSAYWMTAGTSPGTGPGSPAGRRRRSPDRRSLTARIRSTVELDGAGQKSSARATSGDAALPGPADPAADDNPFAVGDIFLTV